MTYLRTILFSLCLLAVFSWTAQGKANIHYTTQNSGIASDSIVDIKIAEDGTVWVVHESFYPDYVGLISRKNDAGWTVFDNLPTIYDSELLENTFIIATQDGLYEFVDGVFSRIEAFGELICRSVVVGKDQTLWVSTVIPYSYGGEAIMHYNPETDTFLESWLVSSYYNSLTVDDDGNVWYLSDSLFRYDGTRWQWIRDVSPSPLQLNTAAVMSGGNLWFGTCYDYNIAPMFNGTSFYRPTVPLGHPFKGPDESAWFFNERVIIRWRDDQYELMYNGLSQITSVALSATSLWIGSYDGIKYIPLDSLLDREPFDSIPCPLELFSTVPEPQSFGDDFYYFPLHIGDTWTYDREVYVSWNQFRNDSVSNAIVDTVTVYDEVYFKFLNGWIMRAGQDSLVYDGKPHRFDFHDPENEKYVFYSDYHPLLPVTRTYGSLSVPAGDFMGYSFGFGLLGGNGYSVVPGVGIAYWDSYDDVGNLQYFRLTSTIVGGRTIDQIMPVEEQPLPYELSITAYPNPFNPATTISFTLPETAQVTLTVYTISGQKVVTLVDGMMNAGAHEVVFDGTGLASGLYVYRLESQEYGKSGKMLLMK